MMKIQIILRRTMEIPHHYKIAMHALNGIKPMKNTFTQYVIVGNVKAISIVDSGSTSTFMTPEIAEMAPCTMCPTRKENVEVADGETL
jgi:hypothetical protein